MPVYLSYWVQIRLLLADKTPTKVSTKYSDYTDVFLFDLVIKLPENTSIIKYAIELVDDK